MVKLTDPLGSSEARGSLGGTVYNTWRGIHYARTKVSPANPNSPSRLAARAIAKQVTARWKLINDLQRSWWNDYATSHTLSQWTGSPKRISGFNWFMKANFYRVALSLAIVDTPPIYPAPTGVSSLSAVTSGSSIIVSWSLAPGYLASSQQVDLWLSYPMSTGREPKIQDSKHLAFCPAEDGSYTTPAVVPASYGIFARVIHETDGLCSPWRLVKHTREGISFGSVGPSYPTVGESLLPEVNEWIDPENICALDSSLAECLTPGLHSSDVLSGSHFNFSPPAVCSILGVLARVYFSASVNGSFTAQLRDSSGPIGAAKVVSSDGSGFYWVSFGGSSDKWSAVLSSAIISSDLFGLDLVCYNSDSVADVFSVDAFELTVYYST